MQKGVTEDEMIGWHHRLNRYEFKQTPRDSEGQESLACCSSWGRKVSDMTKQLNNKNKSGLNNKHLFLTVPEDGNLRSEGQ